MCNAINGCEVFGCCASDIFLFDRKHTYHSEPELSKCPVGGYLCKNARSGTADSQYCAALTTWEKRLCTKQIVQAHVQQIKI